MLFLARDLSSCKRDHAGELGGIFPCSQFTTTSNRWPFHRPPSSSTALWHMALSSLGGPLARTLVPRLPMPSLAQLRTPRRPFLAARAQGAQFHRKFSDRTDWKKRRIISIAVKLHVYRSLVQP